MRVETQKQQVLAMLKHRPITAKDAVTIGCMRLAARIHDLRTDGHEIHSEMVRYDGVRFAQYHLVRQAPSRRSAA